MNHLSFRLGDSVIIKASGETAEVVSRAEHATAEPSYYLRYCRADGHAVEQWWSQSALQDNDIKASSEVGAGSARVADSCATAPIAVSVGLPISVSLALRDRLEGKERDLQAAEQDVDGLGQALTKARRRWEALSREAADLRATVGLT